jgi:hypothetical protein
MIRAVHELNPPLWLPNFENVRTAILGVPFSSWDAEEIGMLSPANVAPLFLLPNIKTVYLGELYEPDNADVPFGIILELPESSSSVEHLFFERAHPAGVKESINEFIRSAKGLKSLIVKDCEFNDFDARAGWAVKSGRGITLQTLLWSESDGDMRGYRSRKFNVEEIVPSMHGIRILALDVEDVLNGCSAGYSSEYCTDIVENYDFTHADFIEYFQWLVGDCLRGLEVLVFKLFDATICAGTVRVINAAIVELIKLNFDEDRAVKEDEDTNGSETSAEEQEQEDGEADGEEMIEEELEVVEVDEDRNDGNYEPFRSIYLDEVVASVYDESIGKHNATLGSSLFEEAALRGSEHGITLHVEDGATARYFRKVCDGILSL